MAQTLAGSHHYEEVIKKSRFIARAAPASSTAEAMEFIASVSEADANHNCWAYRIGGEYRFTDAGEPGGTAGRPILQAIDGQGLDLVVVVVTRYFGGIKLGAGGLVRAYGGTAASCLRLADKRPIVQVERWSIAVPFEVSGSLHAWLARSGARKLDEAFTSEGIEVEVELNADQASSQLEDLRDASRGRARATKSA